KGGLPLFRCTFASRGLPASAVEPSIDARHPLGGGRYRVARGHRPLGRAGPAVPGALGLDQLHRHVHRRRLPAGVQGRCALGRAPESRAPGRGHRIPASPRNYRAGGGHRCASGEPAEGPDMAHPGDDHQPMGARRGPRCGDLPARRLRRHRPLCCRDGGRHGGLLRPGAGPSLPVRPLLGAGAVLLLSQLTPSPLSWLLPLALAIAAGIWAAWRHIYPVACGALGAYCNELVRAANGGRMPVEGHGMLSTLGNRTDTYVLSGPHTNFAWLDDRFQLPAPFPGIASAGDILIAVGMAWFV